MEVKCWCLNKAEAVKKMKDSMNMLFSDSEILAMELCWDGQALKIEIAVNSKVQEPGPLCLDLHTAAEIK